MCKVEDTLHIRLKLVGCLIISKHCLNIPVRHAQQSGSLDSSLYVQLLRPLINRCE